MELLQVLLSLFPGLGQVEEAGIVEDTSSKYMSKG
jgi:hypothetical protein